MNIFFLDWCAKVAATSQCDKHVVKLLLECAQLLSGALQLLLPQLNPDGLYKLTHKNHPCSIWVRTSRLNFDWTVEHALELCAEYTRRYHKIHKSQQVLLYIKFIFENTNIPFPVLGFTTPPRCMPVEYHISDDVVECYRAYYIGDKSRFAVWKYSAAPEWFSDSPTSTSGNRTKK